LAGLVALAALPVAALPTASAAEPKLPPLRVTIDKERVDLERGELEVRLSRPAARVTLKVVGQSGAVVAEVDQRFDAAPAGSPLIVRWTPEATDPVARIEVFGHDTSGYYQGVAITPWSFDVPHQDVVFATDSATVDPSEDKKLKESLSRISEVLKRHGSLGPVVLYLAAHTDTVGAAEYNKKLSTRRAKAIGRWFRSHGLKIPIAYDGLGEAALKVATADEVDEAQNRRVDYCLSLDPPRFKRSGVSPQWKRL
jgi:outer membrane protein OmpA-like peptidoglycan-associated protein